MSRRTWVTLLRALAAVLLLAGCTADRGSEPAPSVPSAPPTQARAFPDGTARQMGDGSRHSALVLTGVRVAVHEGFDRIVLEFSGSGEPGWVVNYVDDAVLDGSGRHLDLGGDATLDIYASGTTWPAPGYYDGPRRVPRSGGEVAEVYVAGTFEGTTQVLAGIDGDPVPFRVSTRTSPARLVVDVADATG